MVIFVECSGFISVLDSVIVEDDTLIYRFSMSCIRLQSQLWNPRRGLDGRLTDHYLCT